MDSGYAICARFGPRATPPACDLVFRSIYTIVVQTPPLLNARVPRARVARATVWRDPRSRPPFVRESPSGRVVFGKNRLNSAVLGHFRAVFGAEVRFGDTYAVQVVQVVHPVLTDRTGCTRCTVRTTVWSAKVGSGLASVEFA